MQVLETGRIAEKTISGVPARNGIQVIARAAKILRTLQRTPEGMSLGEIAKQVDLPRSTVQRIVDALHRENLIFLSCKNGVRLGPALLSLAKATRFKISKLARPTLELLAKETGETVELSLVDVDKVVTVDQVLGNHPLIAISELGVSMKLHSTACGKALLAGMTKSEFTKFKNRMKLTAQTDKTITSWPELNKEITQIIESGLAYDHEENIQGICSVSTSFRSPTDVLSAISISVPTQRFIEKKEALSKILHDQCHPLQIE